MKAGDRWAKVYVDDHLATYVDVSDGTAYYVTREHGVVPAAGCGRDGSIDEFFSSSPFREEKK